LDSAFQTFLKGNGRLIAEVLLDPSDVGTGIADIAGSWRGEAWLKLGAENAIESIHELKDRDGSPCSHVVGGSGQGRGESGTQEGLDRILHIRKVSRLSAIPVNGRRLVLQHGGDEKRDDAGVRAIGTLPRSEDVEKTQSDRLQSKGVGKGLEIQFAGELGSRVRGLGLDGQGFALCLVCPLQSTIGTRASSIDDTLDAMPPGMIEEQKCTGSTSVMGGGGMFYTASHRSQCGKVKHDADIL
jgi:hypothetical protein